MTGADAKADLLARLEAERYAPRPSWQLPPPPVPRTAGDDPWTVPTDPDAAEHRQILLDALSDDPTVVAWRERQAG